MKVLSENKKEYTYSLKATGSGDGFYAITEFAKQLTKRTFVLMDEESDSLPITFFFNGKYRFKTTIEKNEDKSKKYEYTLEISCGSWTELVMMAYFIAMLELRGNTGHSFGYETNHGYKSGFDGDGRDRVKDLWYIDKKIDIYQFAKNSEKIKEDLNKYGYEKMREQRNEHS